MTENETSYADLLAETRLRQILQSAPGNEFAPDDALALARYILGKTVEENGVVAKLRNGQVVLTFDLLPANPPATLSD